MTGKNIGDLLNDERISWGSFMGGFDLTLKNANGTTGCARTTFSSNVNGTIVDYSPHHAWFQYYKSTANPTHARPSSVDAIGHTYEKGGKTVDPANHAYDLEDFYAAVKAGNFPAVSYIKMSAYQDGHAGNSDPLDEQKFLVDTINQIEQSPDWSSTAIIIAYDDSDGWYDHQMGPILRQSLDANDALNGPGKCGSLTNAPTQNDRCGVGPRTPLLVISPWARQNFVDNTFTEQSSVLQFIEDNWNLGRIGNESADASAGTLDNAFDFNAKDKRAPAVILDDNTGEVEQLVPASSGSAGNSSAGGQGSQSSQGSQNGQGGQGNQGSSHGSSSSSKTSSKVKPSKVTCRQSTSHRAITLNCVSSSNAPTLIRVRLFQGKHLIRNQAARVRNHHVRFNLRLGHAAKAGRYTIRLSVDTAGHVAAITRYARIA
jgi:hypothetical protein